MRNILIRVGRLGKRSIKDNYKMLIIVAACIFVFCFIAIPVGISLGYYNDWQDGFWDLKFVFFSTLVLSFAISVTTAETNRHKVLKKQFWTYTDYKNNAEMFLKDVCFVVGFEVKGDVLANRAVFEAFIDDFTKMEYDDKPRKKEIYNSNLMALLENKRMTRKEYIVAEFDQLLYLNNNLEMFLLNNEIIGYDATCKNLLHELHLNVVAEKHFKKDCDVYTDREFADFIVVTAQTIYKIIDGIRKPWTMDNN